MRGIERGPQCYLSCLTPACPPVLLCPLPGDYIADYIASYIECSCCMLPAHGRRWALA